MSLLLDTVRPRAELLALLEFRHKNGNRRIFRRGRFDEELFRSYISLGGPADKYSDEELELIARFEERFNERVQAMFGFNGERGYDARSAFIDIDKQVDADGRVRWEVARATWAFGRDAPTLVQGLSRFYLSTLIRPHWWVCDLTYKRIEVVEVDPLMLADGRAMVPPNELLAIAPTAEELDEMIRLYTAERERQLEGRNRA